MNAPTTTQSRMNDHSPRLATGTDRLHRAAPWLLRGSLAIVLVWFGALKVAGLPTMPGALIAAITPSFVDADLLVRLTGGLEVTLGIGLLVRRRSLIVVAAVAAQMSATFLVLLSRPDVAFIDGNLLALSVEGEYVVKNLVLLAAALALAGRGPARRAWATARR